MPDKEELEELITELIDREESERKALTLNENHDKI